MAQYPVLFQQWCYPQEATHAIQSQSVAERGKKEKRHLKKLCMTSEIFLKSKGLC